ncbi:MAG TPA: hypothetical protein VNR64_18265 [Vicinamibacterales bacterium]|nr:hypothetical protein [Vicinamibacterales bacterium]
MKWFIFMTGFRRAVAGTTLWLLSAAPAMAQTLPAGPAEFAGGAVTLSGTVSVSVGTHDDSAFFNFTDYEHNALRMVRVAVAGTWRMTSRMALLTELRSEDGERVIPYALYLRARPFARVAFDIQAGRIPTVFGAFARRSYRPDDNPLIGYPLAYQYLTSLRPDAIPASADDLLLMRARGWRASYPVGASYGETGVPLISAYRWDTGVEANLALERFDAAVSVTTGTLSSPRTRDDNGRPQVAGRVGWKPALGLIVGASLSRGEFLTGALEDRYRAVLGDHSYAQTAFGLDGEYSKDHWIVRAEWVDSRWRIPDLGVPLIRQPLTATSAYVEGRYRVSPRWYVAGRADMLTFSRVTGQRLFGGLPTTWDAPVKRLEAGVGLYLQRNLTLRVAVQPNWRDGGRVHRRTFTSAELAYWF